MSKKLICLMDFVVLLGLAGNGLAVCRGEVLFYDGFESGDVSAWTGANGNDSYVTTDPYSGNYCGKMTLTGGIDEKDAYGTTTGSLWSFTAKVERQPPGQATNPDPPDGATDVSINADLSWTAGVNTMSHDVYFGTDSTPDSGEFQGNQTSTTYDLDTLEYSTTYYWRIDEINAYGTTTGDVWSFTTVAGAPPGKATNPDPPDGATDVSINADLSWTAGENTMSHDVYFGTDSTPDIGEFQGNQKTTKYDLDTLKYSTTYYWRIDEINAYGTTAGDVWSFTTVSASEEPG